MTIPPADWNNDKKIYEQVKNCQLAYAIYKFVNGQKPTIVVAHTEPPGSYPPLGSFIQDLKDADFGFAIWRAAEEVVPVFFALGKKVKDTNTVITVGRRYKFMGTRLVGPDSTWSVIMDNGGWHAFFKRVQVTRTDG